MQENSMNLKVPTEREFNAIMADPKFPGSSTMSMANRLTDLGQRLPRDVYVNKVAAIFGEIYRRWQVLVKETPGAGRAGMVHGVIDSDLKEFSIDSHSCRKGCAHCCHLEVTITQDEAVMLAAKVNSGVEVDLDRLRQQASIPALMDGGDSAWSGLPAQDRRCVFLGVDNLCRIYEARPAACRKYLVNTPPKDCEDPKGNSAVLSNLSTEIEVSAAYNLGPIGSLPKLLLEALEGKAP